MSNDNSKNVFSNNTSQKTSLGLDRFSYADYVVMSSIIAYAIAEELNEVDLGLLVAFLGMISSDLAVLIVKQGIDNAKTNEASAVDTTVQQTSEEIIESQFQRKSNRKKIKKIKRIKKVKKNHKTK